MSRVKIPVAELEFEEGGNTIWVHGPLGTTVLRVKVSGRLSSAKCAENPSSHLDLVAQDVDPVFCLGPEAES